MSDQSLRDIHWMLEILQTIDVGLVVINIEYEIQNWNGFMENHSGHRAQKVQNRNLFDVFPELPHTWFCQKVDTVRELNIRAFTTWEQRPYLFRFRTYHPITSTAEYMYQNSMLYPLENTSGEVEYIAIVIFDVTDVATNKLALQQANSELARISRTDALTQLYNRGYWEECLYRELLRCRRHQHTASLILLDVDHFKPVNDTHGHTAGDAVLRHLSRTIRQNVRETDIPGRYGGEEFGIILPETDSPKAFAFAERLRGLIEEEAIQIGDNSVSITVSFGVAELEQNMQTIEDWITRADEALYQSKQSGRNQVTAT
ncbi:sensor domain-containing diguanylate cyclase [Natronospirillum operosum]|uniref:diguanylate cyclase n=1 Tax=Natronospirillum operosum TaxID=2759953 RepID=A0A4Z0WHY8_9GAMM|nr:diguanylate cyclase [Natronospirillum operosum]TGG95527.1 sensor domain-containing diguanylate cyclase [Natronospirillum operosum]